MNQNPFERQTESQFSIFSRASLEKSPKTKSFIITKRKQKIPFVTDWDRCRRLCPVQKPKPPLAPGAQLVSFTLEKDVRQIFLKTHFPYKKEIGFEH